MFDTFFAGLVGAAVVLTSTPSVQAARIPQTQEGSGREVHLHEFCSFDGRWKRSRRVARREARQFPTASDAR